MYDLQIHGQDGTAHRCHQTRARAGLKALTLSLDSSDRPTDLYRCALNSYGRPNLGKWLLRMYLQRSTRKRCAASHTDFAYA